MKGEVIDRTKSSALDLNEKIVKGILRELDDELTVEIVWEALDLTGLYIILRIMYYVLLALEYVSPKVRINPLYLIEQKFIQNGNDLLEEGKARLWQIINKYHVSGKVIKMRRQLNTESKKETGLYGNFVTKSHSISIHPMVPYITETITSSYCC
jgi:hypothetical protein